MVITQNNDDYWFCLIKLSANAKYILSEITLQYISVNSEIQFIAFPQTMSVTKC